MAEILNKKSDGKNLRYGYQTALRNGYLCKYLLTSFSTFCHRKALHVLDVQWYIFNPLSLKLYIISENLNISIK